MKIRPVTEEDRPKVLGLLRAAFPGSREEQLVARLHSAGRITHEWVLIHINRAVAYIAFTHAYVGSRVVGLHLAPMAVKPEFQRQGFGSELMRFALRQPQLRELPLFVHGAPAFFEKFGFERCQFPRCPFDTKNVKFRCKNNPFTKSTAIGYEKEFTR